MKTCGTCKHWEDQRPLRDFGECIKGRASDETQSTQLEPLDPDSLMWGQDRSDYGATVHTRPHFHCAMWERDPQSTPAPKARP